MVINSSLSMVLHLNGMMTITSPNFPMATRISKANSNYPSLLEIYNRMSSCSATNRSIAFDGVVDNIKNHYYSNSDELKNALLYLGMIDGDGTPTTSAPTEAPTIRTIDCEKVIGDFMKFFSEFSFTPSFRFMNTLCFKTRKNVQEGIDYITNYFNLCDDSYKNEVAEKMRCDEFKSLMNDFHEFPEPDAHTNTRLKIYFGSQGTGKTTKAQQETDNRCMVCNSSMLPSDLMEDFDFDSGSPTFKKSLLWECMEQGLPVVLDEINLLPFDSLRFLQGITDGKSDFCYKNKAVHIAEGFQIIGTMNLSLGGMTYGLPVPLVDRCADIKEYTLTAKQLMRSVISNGTVPLTITPVTADNATAEPKPTATTTIDGVEMPF